MRARESAYNIERARVVAQRCRCLLCGGFWASGHRESAAGSQRACAGSPAAATHPGGGVRTHSQSHTHNHTHRPAVVSSRDDHAVVAKCLSLGAADFLCKPLRHNELRNIWTRVWWWRRVGAAEMQRGRAQGD